MLFEIAVPTEEHVQLVDITHDVQRIVWNSHIKHGIVVVFTRHTTTGIIINEAEGGLLRDIKSKMEELVPAGKGYSHDRIDSNAHSHLRASLLLNTEVVLPVDEGELQLGTWQRVLFVELDGPRHRKVQVMVCPCPENFEE